MPGTGRRDSGSGAGTSPRTAALSGGDSKRTNNRKPQRTSGRQPAPNPVEQAPWRDAGRPSPPDLSIKYLAGLDGVAGMKKHNEDNKQETDAPELSAQFRCHGDSLVRWSRANQATCGVQNQARRATSTQIRNRHPSATPPRRRGARCRKAVHHGSIARNPASESSGR